MTATIWILFIIAFASIFLSERYYDINKQKLNKSKQRTKNLLKYIAGFTAFFILFLGIYSFHTHKNPDESSFNNRISEVLEEKQRYDYEKIISDNKNIKTTKNIPIDSILEEVVFKEKKITQLDLKLSILKEDSITIRNELRIAKQKNKRSSNEISELNQKILEYEELKLKANDEISKLKEENRILLAKVEALIKLKPLNRDNIQPIEQGNNDIISGQPISNIDEYLYEEKKTIFFKKYGPTNIDSRKFRLIALLDKGNGESEMKEITYNERLPHNNIKGILLRYRIRPNSRDNFNPYPSSISVASTENNNKQFDLQVKLYKNDSSENAYEDLILSSKWPNFSEEKVGQNFILLLRSNNNNIPQIEKGTYTLTFGNFTDSHLETTFRLQ